MIRVKNNRDGTLCIIEDGKIMSFDRAGQFKGQLSEPISKYMDGVLNLPVISILSSEGKTNIGIWNGVSFIEFDSSKRGTDCMSKLYMAKGFVKMLQMKGNFEDIRFQQIIFLYPEGTDVMSYKEKVV